MLWRVSNWYFLNIFNVGIVMISMVPSSQPAIIVDLSNSTMDFTIDSVNTYFSFLKLNMLNSYISPSPSSTTEHAKYCKVSSATHMAEPSILNEVVNSKVFGSI